MRNIFQFLLLTALVELDKARKSAMKSPNVSISKRNQLEQIDLLADSLLVEINRVKDCMNDSLLIGKINSKIVEKKTRVKKKMLSDLELVG